MENCIMGFVADEALWFWKGALFRRVTAFETMEAQLFFRELFYFGIGIQFC